MVHHHLRLRKRVFGVQEAELINRFIARASKAEPNGRLVVANNDHIANIRLQDGDVITIPERSDSLLISGEVLVPQSVVFATGKTVEDYIDGAGGFSQHADESKILIVRQMVKYVTPMMLY